MSASSRNRHRTKDSGRTTSDDVETQWLDGYGLAKVAANRRARGSSPDPQVTMETVADTTAAFPAGSVLRVLFGLIWLIDAYFKWQPSFLHGMLSVMHEGTMGQPKWLMPWFQFNRATMATQPLVWAYGIAVLETAIALAVLFGVARKVTYIVGAGWSMLIWATAEGFGHTRSGVATDIGAGIVYALVFVGLLALDQYGRTRPYSLDGLLERRLPGWQSVAEVRGLSRTSGMSSLR